MDKLSKEKRSWNMSRIRSKDTTPELFIRHSLWKRGIRYRKNDKYVFGKPDLYISKYRCAIFVNGCFWHRHTGCKNCTTPHTRYDFWQKKFQTNIDRDQLVRKTLNEENIRVIVIWECTAEKAVKNESIINDIYTEITDGKKIYCEF